MDNRVTNRADEEKKSGLSLSSGLVLPSINDTKQAGSLRERDSHSSVARRRLSVRGA